MERSCETLEELAGLEKLTGLRVYRDYGEEEELWVSWSTGDGWFAPGAEEEELVEG